MCKVVPNELIEALVNEYRAELAAEEAARKAAAADKARPAPPRPAAGDNRLKRCRAYLLKVAPSVEGQDGSKRIFHAARVIWNDFGLDEAEGYPLLEEFNQKSDPPWEEDGKQGLRRKWAEAVAKGPGPEGRGHRLAEDRPDRKPDRRPAPRAAADPLGDDGGGAAGPAAAGGGGGGLPDIVFNNRQYRDVEADALAALVRANVPPRVFVGNGCGLVDLQRAGPDSPVAARELDAASVRPIFARAANWLREREGQGGGELVDDYPPPALLSSFPARGEWPGLPFLRSVVTYPVFGPGWRLNATQGYHPDSLIYCDLGGLAVPPVPAAPTAAEVAAARSLILDDLLVDFPFVGEPGPDNPHRANAVAMLLLPVIRHAIDGPTPLGVLDAPTEGTGKSLLAEAITLTTVGEIPEAVSPDMADEEWNKFLLAELIAGQPVIFFDNANRRLDSGALAGALTAKYKRGRILGETKVARALVNVCWLLTGNNFDCSREMARRVYWSRIDRGVENPSAEPVPFRHPDLLGWVRDNRHLLIAAVITLVNNWLAKGRPPGSAKLGKFEAWAAAVGGILEAAGIGGLLGNADDFRRLSTSQAAEMPEFLAKWYEKHAGTKVIANDLFDCADGVLDHVLTAKDEKGRRTQLGKFLRTQRDKVYGEWRIRFCLRDDGKEDKDYAGRPRYQLGRARPRKPAAGPAAPAEYADGEEGFDLTG